MALDYERNIDDIKEDIDDAKAHQGVTVLIGAGASKSAGIPLAGGFCGLIKDRFPEKYARAEDRGDTGYQALMGQLTAAQRQQVLGDAIDQARINWAHIALAGLVRAGYVTRVLTPNFDPLVVQACALLNRYPAVYDFATATGFKPNNVSTPAVYYLHGQRTGFRLLNREKECERHARTLGPVINEAAGLRPWIVVGYSGENDPLFRDLLKKQSFDGGLYWVSHTKDEPPRHLDGFLSEDESRYYVRGYDADSFFIRLAARLDCFPPALVEDPFGHLMERYEQIVPDHPQSEENRTGKLLEQARAKVRAAAASDAAPASADEQAADDLTDLRVALAAGEYDRVIAAFEASEDPSDELRDLAASAYTWQGADIAIAARQVKDAGEARVGFERAIKKYAAAVNVKPDFHEALYNWGVALAAIAERTEDAEEARATFERAIEKYAAAVDVKPDFHEALTNWGVALADIAERTADAGEARATFERAIEKYAAAVDVKPDKHEALNNWGVALAGIAERTEGAEEARATFERAIEKYAAAVDVKPDFHEALYNWGIALLHLLERTPDDAEAVAERAEEVLLRAQVLNPDQVYNLACLYAKTGRPEEAKDLLVHAKGAGTLPDADHLRADTDLEAVRDEPWFADLLGED